MTKMPRATSSLSLIVALLIYGSQPVVADVVLTHVPATCTHSQVAR